jgi:hypothetical protein
LVGIFPEGAELGMVDYWKAVVCHNAGNICTLRWFLCRSKDNTYLYPPPNELSKKLIERNLKINKISEQQNYFSHDFPYRT